MNIAVQCTTACIHVNHDHCPRYVCMPGMTGLEAMRKILKIVPGIKIIFISADMSIEGDALKAGAKEFLHKPVKPRDIIEAIKDTSK